MLSALKAVIQCQNQGTKGTKSYEKRLTIHNVKSFGKVNDDCSCMWEGRVKLAETAEDCGCDEGNDEYYGLVRSHINQYVKVEGRT